MKSGISCYPVFTAAHSVQPPTIYHNSYIIFQKSGRIRYNSIYYGNAF